MHLRVDVDFDALADWISDGIAYVGPDGIIAAWSAGASSPAASSPAATSLSEGIGGDRSG